MPRKDIETKYDSNNSVTGVLISEIKPIFEQYLFQIPNEKTAAATVIPNYKRPCPGKKYLPQWLDRF